jgi:hypothetical protein
MGNVVAVGDLEGYVHFLSGEDGSFASRIKVDSDPVMSMIPGNANNQVIVATRGGGLYALSTSAMPDRAKSGTSNNDSETSNRRSPLPYYGDVPAPVPASKPKEESAPAPAINTDKSELEKTIVETVEPAPDSTATEGANTDSIMFKKDPMVIDSGASPESGQQ